MLNPARLAWACLVGSHSVAAAVSAWRLGRRFRHPETLVALPPRAWLPRLATAKEPVRSLDDLIRLLKKTPDPLARGADVMLLTPHLEKALVSIGASATPAVIRHHAFAAPIVCREELGRGAFGAVFVGTCRDAPHPCLAVKFNTSQTSRWDDEIENLALMRPCPHVVALLGHGAQHGVQYLLSEYVRGPTLEAELGFAPRQRGWLGQSYPLPRALELLRQLATALRFGHCEAAPRPIVHRDLKPENIKIGEARTPNGPIPFLKLLDYGLSRNLAVRPGRTSDWVGTHPYMAPEQIRTFRFDARSDVFAFGLVAFELLVGVRHNYPFAWFDKARGLRDSVELLDRCAARDGLPELRRLRPALPEPLHELLHACCRNRPEDRPNDGGAILDALDRMDRVAMIESAPVPMQAAAGRMRAHLGGIFTRHKLTEMLDSRDLGERASAWRAASAALKKYATGIPRAVAADALFRAAEEFASETSAEMLAAWPQGATEPLGNIDDIWWDQIKPDLEALLARLLDRQFGVAEA